MTLGIVGLGLMGGSLGLAAEGPVIGYDAQNGVAEEALRRGAISDAGSLQRIADECELIVVAVPVDVAPAVIMQLGELGARGTITDVGSVKRPIVDAMNALPEGASAIAAHPMCGREIPGIEGAVSDLYTNARWAICPTTRTDDVAHARLTELLEHLSCTWIEIDAAEHDRVVAVTSHVPYLVGAALSLSVDERAGETLLFGGGLRDATRLAAGSDGMWRAIVTNNRDEIAAALSAVEGELDRVRRALADGDHDVVADWLARAAARARGLRASV